jgi:hypothetical protein
VTSSFLPPGPRTVRQFTCNSLWYLSVTLMTAVKLYFRRPLCYSSPYLLNSFHATYEITRLKHWDSSEGFLSVRLHQGKKHMNG